MINEKEFYVLVEIESSQKKLSQRDISHKTNYSVGTVNSTLASLIQKELIKDNLITQKGLDELKPYKVNRAIFIAAGFGSRMVPITLNTPKPLVRVKGSRLIDTMLDAVLKADIKEIYIVRGYLSEQFDQLLYKYPNIQFIENPLYNESNNISSVLSAKDFLDNTYILEADIYLKNPDLIKKYQYNSNYCGVKCNSTDDWCLYYNKGRITGVSVGGTDGYRMLGISYWTKEDGKKLADCVEKAFKLPGGKERYWDSVPLTIFSNNFNLTVRECSFDDFTELDTFSELKAFDNVYATK